LDLSQVPTFREFLAANKEVLKKRLPTLFELFALTFFVWRIEVWRPPILPSHYVFEIVSFAYAGIFVASLKKTVLPTELIVLIGYLGSVLVTLFTVLEFEPFWIVFLLVFASPLPLAYAMARLKQVLKKRKAGAPLRNV